MLKVKAGRVSATQFLSLLSACSEEDDYTVWATLDGGVGAIANVLSRANNESLKTRFDAFVRKAYSPVAAKLGWDAAKDEGSFFFSLLYVLYNCCFHRPLGGA